MNRRKRPSETNGQTTISSRRPLVRQNVALGYVDNQNAALPFDLANMVGEYTGGVCDALTYQGNKCPSELNRVYSDPDLGEVNCSSYCTSYWRQWLLPILTTTVLDSTWVQINQIPEESQSSMNILTERSKDNGKQQYKVALEVGRRLDYSFELSLTTYNSMTVQVICGSEQIDFIEDGVPTPTSKYRTTLILEVWRKENVELTRQMFDLVERSFLELQHSVWTVQQASESNAIGPWLGRIDRESELSIVTTLYYSDDAQESLRLHQTLYRFFDSLITSVRQRNIDLQLQEFQQQQEQQIDMDQSESETNESEFNEPQEAVGLSVQLHVKTEILIRLRDYSFLNNPHYIIYPLVANSVDDYLNNNGQQPSDARIAEEYDNPEAITEQDESSFTNIGSGRRILSNYWERDFSI